MVRIKTTWAPSEHWTVADAEASMDDAAQKLRSLARQSRTLAWTTANRQRADALQALARLYEKQAEELEAA